MNEIETVIIFFAFLFAGSLLYRAKRKHESLLSFLENLELEYIFVGIAIFSMTGSLPVPVPTMNGMLYLLLAFMGLSLGTHFSVKLLLTVPLRYFIFTGIVYLSLLPLLYVVVRVSGFSSPMMTAIALNTLMPYSLNLSMKLFRVPKDKVFTSNLTASLFPLYTLLAYSVAGGILDYRPSDFLFSMMAALVLAFIFLHYGKIRSKKNIHNLSIIYVVMISGVALFFSMSPLVVGFLTGLITSDTKYGNIFQNMSISFERILYIFFYVALGVMLAYGYSFSPGAFLTAGVLYLCFFAVRFYMAKLLAWRLIPTKGEVICLVSTGILPAVLFMDFATRRGYEAVAGLFVPFFMLHLATEITTYFMMKNERKTY